MSLRHQAEREREKRRMATKREGRGAHREDQQASGKEAELIERGRPNDEQLPRHKLK